MIHTLDTRAADYIPELGDGFEESSEGSKKKKAYRQPTTMRMRMAKASTTSRIRLRLRQMSSNYLYLPEESSFYDWGRERQAK